MRKIAMAYIGGVIALILLMGEKEILVPDNTQIISVSMNPGQEIERQAQIIDKYYRDNGMPLEGYGKEMALAAQKYKLDWRLLPAITVQESSGGKRMYRQNPFGWAIYGDRVNGYSQMAYFEGGVSDAIKCVAWNLAGENPKTAKYYSSPDISQKLKNYNPNPAYPPKIFKIMEDIKNSGLLQASVQGY
jgi:hypothetical protein